MTPWHIRLLRKLGIDRAIGYTVILQFVNLVSKPGLMALMIIYLTKEEQGYQYTILGLIGLRALFEMGLGITVVSFVGKESAHVSFDRLLGVSGDDRSVRRVASLFQLILRAYIAIGILFGILMMWGGWYFLSQGPNADSIHWQMAWIVAVSSTAVSFMIDGIGNFVLGIGHMSNVVKCRFFSTMAQIIIYASLLAGGAGLLAAPLANLVSVFVLAIVLLGSYRKPLLELWRTNAGDDAFHWRKDILPFQWRVAVSWFCGYILAQAIIPIAFETLGDVTAGQIGLSLAFSGIIYGIAFGWVAFRQPRFGALVGRGEFVELRRLFFFAFKRALAVQVLGIVAMSTLIVAIGYWKPQFLQRILPWELMALVFLSGLMMTFVDCLSVCLSSFQKEPFMPMRIVAAIATASGTYIAARVGGVEAMIATLTAIYCLSGIVAWWVWRRKMALWTQSA